MELKIPMMEGPLAFEIIISNTLLKMACHDLWGHNGQPIEALVKLRSLTKDALVLGSFLHYSILPLAH